MKRFTMRVMTKSQVAPALLHLDKIIGAANFKQFIHAKDSVVLVPKTAL